MVQSPVSKYQHSRINFDSQHFKGSEMPSIRNLITDRYSLREAKIAQSVMQKSKQSITSSNIGLLSQRLSVDQKSDVPSTVDYNQNKVYLKNLYLKEINNFQQLSPINVIKYRSPQNNLLEEKLFNYQQEKKRKLEGFTTLLPMSLRESLQRLKEKKIQQTTMTNLPTNVVSKLIEQHRKVVKNYNDEEQIKIDQERKEKEQEIQQKLEKRRTHLFSQKKKEPKLNPDLQNIFDKDFSSLKPIRNNKTSLNFVKQNKVAKENYFEEQQSGLITNRLQDRVENPSQIYIQDSLHSELNTILPSIQVSTCDLNDIINNIIVPQQIKKQFAEAQTQSGPFQENALRIVKSKMFSDVISDYSDDEQEKIRDYKNHIKSAKQQDDRIKEFVISQYPFKVVQQHPQDDLGTSQLHLERLSQYKPTVKNMKKQPLHHKQFNLEFVQKKKNDIFPHRNLVSKSVSQTPFEQIRNSKVLQNKIKSRINEFRNSTQLKQFGSQLNKSQDNDSEVEYGYDDSDQDGIIKGLQTVSYDKRNQNPIQFDKYRTSQSFFKRPFDSATDATFSQTKSKFFQNSPISVSNSMTIDQRLKKLKKKQKAKEKKLLHGSSSQESSLQASQQQLVRQTSLINQYLDSMKTNKGHIVLENQQEEQEYGSLPKKKLKIYNNQRSSMQKATINGLDMNLQNEDVMRQSLINWNNNTESIIEPHHRPTKSVLIKNNPKQVLDIQQIKQRLLVMEENRVKKMEEKRLMSKKVLVNSLKLKEIGPHKSLAVNSQQSQADNLSPLHSPKIKEKFLLSPTKCSGSELTVRDENREFKSQKTQKQSRSDLKKLEPQELDKIDQTARKSFSFQPNSNFQNTPSKQKEQKESSKSLAFESPGDCQEQQSQIRKTNQSKMSSPRADSKDLPMPKLDNSPNYSRNEGQAYQHSKSFSINNKSQSRSQSPTPLNMFPIHAQNSPKAVLESRKKLGSLPRGSFRISFKDKGEVFPIMKQILKITDKQRSENLITQFNTQKTIRKEMEEERKSNDMRDELRSSIALGNDDKQSSASFSESDQFKSPRWNQSSPTNFNKLKLTMQKQGSGSNFLNLEKVLQQKKESAKFSSITEEQVALTFDSPLLKERGRKIVDHNVPTEPKIISSKGSSRSLIDTSYSHLSSLKPDAVQHTEKEEEEEILVSEQQDYLALPTEEQMKKLTTETNTISKSLQSSSALSSEMEIELQNTIKSQDSFKFSIKKLSPQQEVSDSLLSSQDGTHTASGANLNFSLNSPKQYSAKAKYAAKQSLKLQRLDSIKSENEQVSANMGDRTKEENAVEKQPPSGGKPTFIVTEEEFAKLKREFTDRSLLQQVKQIKKEQSIRESSKDVVQTGRLSQNIMPYGVLGDSSANTKKNSCKLTPFESPAFSNRIANVKNLESSFKIVKETSNQSKEMEYEIESDLNSISIVDSVSSNPTDEVLDQVPLDLLDQQQIKNQITSSKQLVSKEGFMFKDIKKKEVKKAKKIEKETRAKGIKPMEKFQFDSFKMPNTETNNHLNPNFDTQEAKKKLKESNTKLLFKIKETNRENSASDIMNSDDSPNGNESVHLGSQTLIDQANILEATRSKSVKNLLKKETFIMPNTKISFQDNTQEIKKFIKMLNRDVDEMPEELQIIVKMKNREQERIQEKIEDDKNTLIIKNDEFAEKMDKRRTERKASSSAAKAEIRMKYNDASPIRSPAVSINNSNRQTPGEISQHLQLPVVIAPGDFTPGDLSRNVNISQNSNPGDLSRNNNFNYEQEFIKRSKDEGTKSQRPTRNMRKMTNIELTRNKLEELKESKVIQGDSPINKVRRFIQPSVKVSQQLIMTQLQIFDAFKDTSWGNDPFAFQHKDVAKEQTQQKRKAPVNKVSQLKIDIQNVLK